MWSPPPERPQRLLGINIDLTTDSHSTVLSANLARLRFRFQVPAREIYEERGSNNSRSFFWRWKTELDLQRGAIVSYNKLHCQNDTATQQTISYHLCLWITEFAYSGKAIIFNEARHLILPQKFRGGHVISDNVTKRTSCFTFIAKRGKRWRYFLFPPVIC